MSPDNSHASSQGPAGQPRVTPNACAELLARLAGRPPAEARYDVLDEVGRGGMGRVLRVQDKDLHRELAMKVLLDPSDGAPASSPTTPSQHRARFLEEAQVAGQLDHPGIVPVHDVGLTAEGRLYFTMKLVRGRTLQELIAASRTDAREWSLTRIVGVILRVVEAMDYAHERGVVHRDLKPSNVMAGRHGEVYVMDWGLALLVGTREDGTREREVTGVYSVRQDAATGETPGTFVTDYGVVIGTPSYLPPERALPDGTSNAKTDIYAVGAMLYTAIAGVAPYSDQAKRTNNHQVWLALQQGPPTPLEKLAPNVPAELVSICDKAMARDVTQRYASMREFAEDLRAYVEVRVVRAHRTGALVELKKWIARNRATAAAIGAAVLVLAGAGFLVANQQEALASERFDRLHVVEREAREAASIDLIERAEKLWPIAPQRAPEMEAWLTDARELVKAREEYTRLVDEYERDHAQAARVELPRSSTVLHDSYVVEALRTRRAGFEEELAKLRSADPKPAHAEHDAAVLERELLDLPRWIAREERGFRHWRSWMFADVKLEAEFSRLVRVRDALEDAGAPDTGLIASMSDRAQRSARLREVTIDAYRSKWDEVIAELRQDARFPSFAERPLTPQIGLVPLGRDPQSGNHEFWVACSGERPQRGNDGRWSIREETGIVLVLVPGGKGWMRAQDSDPSKPNYVPRDPDPEKALNANELVPVAYDLEPYFLSKYELTQGQWLRLVGSNPSEYWAGMGKRVNGVNQPRVSRAHPVESVSWNACSAMLARWNLELPTEAQFEHAARAGGSTVYEWGNDAGGRVGRVNWKDASASRAEVRSVAANEPDDGFPVHAPVDALPPNAWGLHAMTGNVREWCRDWFAAKCEAGALLPGTCEHRPHHSVTRATRGGGFLSPTDELRVTRRYGAMPDSLDQDQGVRPSRALDP